MPANYAFAPFVRSAPFRHMRYIYIEYKSANMAASEANEGELPTDSFEVHGHEVMEKEAKPVGTGAHVLVPKKWLGERVKIVRVTKTEGEEE